MKNKLRDKANEEAAERVKAEVGSSKKTVKVKVFCRSTYFDGLARHRRGSQVTLEVPLVRDKESGEDKPKLPLWAVLPEDWEQELQAEREAEQSARRKGVRGRVSGGLDL